MEFDAFTVSWLESATDPPKLSEREENELQDAHMAYLAELHDTGRLDVAGPTTSPPNRTLRGVCVSRIPPDEVAALLENDPAIRAGQLTFRVFGWMVPKGSITFGSVRYPRAMSEV